MTTTPQPGRRCCRVCPQLRQGEPRIYDRPNVCQGCRSRLRALLAEIVDLHGEIILEKGSVAGAKISGSRTPPLPLAVDALDLTMPAHQGIVHDPQHDQCGDLSVATILDSWARDWQSYAWALLPEPNVKEIAAWLTERLDWACDEHAAIDDFAHEIAELARKLRPRPPRAELKIGVPCRDCERLTLFRWPGSDFVECGSCPCLLTPEEYERWVALISAPEHIGWAAETIEKAKESAHERG